MALRQHNQPELTGVNNAKMTVVCRKISELGLILPDEDRNFVSPKVTYRCVLGLKACV